jgi:hypothetical protein
LEKFKGPEIFERILKDEPLNEMQMGFSFPLNHKLYWTFSEVIRRLNEAGVTKRLIEKYYENLNPKFHEKPIQIVDENGRKRIHKEYLETTWHQKFLADKEPKVLSFSDLEFGFVIWLGSLILPLIAFLIEIICILITKIRNRNQVEDSNQELFEVSETQIEEISFKSSESNKNKNSEKLESLDIIKTLEEIEAIDDVFGARIEILNEDQD